MKSRGASAVRDKAHTVRFFKDSEELVESVCDFATTGLELGDSVLLAVTNAHAARIRRELGQRGYAAGLAETTFLDAEALAEDLAGARGVRPAAYARLVEEEVAAAAARARTKRARAYGEIVDVLWRRGLEDAALALEHRWHETCLSQPLRLLCGYRLSLMHCRCLDIAQTHDAVESRPPRPQEAGRTLRELEKLLGSQANMLRALVAEHKQLSALPFEQAALLWIGRHMPATAARLQKALEA